MTRFRLAASASALAIFASVTLSGAALAQEVDPAVDAIGAAIETASAQASIEASEDKALGLDDLADISGGAVDINVEDSALSNQELTANNSDNTIGGDVTGGDIKFSEGAFANFNGVGNVVVNTGVQANIQGSINVTINGTSF